MSQFLDKTGLSHFWGKAKTWIGNNYYGKKTGVSISEKKVEVKENTDITTTTHTGITVLDTATSDASYITSDVVKVTNTATPKNTSEVHGDQIISPKFVKKDGKATEVLLANGEVAKLLNAQGKIDASNVAIDTTLFSIVTELPKTNIVKNRIYLVKSNASGTQNIYAEYIYTGDVNATYDGTKWEKLGEYKSDVDLSSYAKKADMIDTLLASATADQVTVNASAGNLSIDTAYIKSATTSNAGVMSASDKKGLDTLLNRYKLTITTFTASPSLVEVGASADITFAWTLSNTDFHPVTSQSISVDGEAAVPVANGTLNYKKTGLAGATAAGTKKATLTINSHYSKEVSITYHYPTYVGVVAQGTTMNATAIQKLTKSVEWGRGATKGLTQNNQVIVYAYPASYGDLSSIKDKNGFDGIGGYTKSVVVINSVIYNVYVQKLPATVSNGTFTFA